MHIVHRLACVKHPQITPGPTILQRAPKTAHPWARAYVDHSNRFRVHLIRVGPSCAGLFFAAPSCHTMRAQRGRAYKWRPGGYQ